MPQRQVTMLHYLPAHNACNINNYIKITDMKSKLGGHSSVTYRFFLEIGPPPTPHNANNIEHYTFVTLFSRKSDTPHPHLRYVTLEWPPDLILHSLDIYPTIK